MEYLKERLDLSNEKFLMFTMDQMANEYEKTGNKAIRMTLGKSELSLHPDIINAMVQAINDPMKRNYVFPGGLPELKQVLATFYNKKYGKNFSSKNFIISPGTSTTFRNLLQLLLSKGDECLIPKPYYCLYPIVCKILPSIKIKFYNINIETKKIDFESFKENFTDKTKIVIINSPGNPLGNIISKEEILELDNVINGKAILISDEIYNNVCFSGYASSIIEIENLKSEYIVTNSCSKAYRMYARRVGWCLIPNNYELINNMTILQEHTMLTTDPVVQYGAIAAIKNQKEVLDLEQLYKQRRDYTIHNLSKANDIKVIPADGSFYITIECKDYLKKQKMNNILDLAKEIFSKTHVATVPGSDFGIPTLLRLSYTDHNYNLGIDKLAEFFEKT